MPARVSEPKNVRKGNAVQEIREAFHRSGMDPATLSTKEYALVYGGKAAWAEPTPTLDAAKESAKEPAGPPDPRSGPPTGQPMGPPMGPPIGPPTGPPSAAAPPSGPPRAAPAGPPAAPASPSSAPAASSGPAAASGPATAAPTPARATPTPTPTPTAAIDPVAMPVLARAVATHGGDAKRSGGDPTSSVSEQKGSGGDPGGTGGWDQKRSSGGQRISGGDQKGSGDLGNRVPVSAPGDLSSLVGLAASLTASNVAAWSGDDRSLQAILTGPFESNWFKAKDCLLMDGWPSVVKKKPDHAVAITLMQALVAWRAKVCGEVQRRVEAEIQQRVKDEAARVHGPNDALGEKDVTEELARQAAAPNEEMRDKEGKGTGKKGPHVNFEQPKGNDKPSSDVDISTKGANTEIAVALFNETFREMLRVPYESGTMFDYNVYAEDWVHNLQFDRVERDGKSITTKVTPGVQHQEVADEARAARTQASDKASLLHIRRYCTKNEWDSYVVGRTAGLEGEERRRMIILLAEVEFQHGVFEDLIAKKSVVAAKEIERAEQDHRSAWDEHQAHHFHDEAVRTSASNRIYEERLREVKKLRVKYALLAKKAPLSPQDRAELAHLATETTRVLSEALYFANEVYATEGAVLHTVVGIQIGDKTAENQGGLKPAIGLSKDQYAQSFNENVGDVLKDLTHFKDNPPFAYFRAGKYMNRMLMAARALTPKASAHSDYAEFSKIAEVSVAAKEDKVIGNDPLACAQRFKEADKASLAALRTRVIEFGTAIPKLASEPPPQVSASPSPASPSSAPSAASAASPAAAAAPPAATAAPPTLQRATASVLSSVNDLQNTSTVVKK